VRAALAILVVLALAGCGSSEVSTQTKEGYAAALLSSLGKISAPNGNVDMSELASDYRDAGNELAEITPPAEIADAHGRLVAGLRMEADQLERYAAARDAVAAAEAATTAQQVGQSWTQALNEIQAKGYATVTSR
jgi:uncharacterized lipoprotein